MSVVLQECMCVSALEFLIINKVKSEVMKSHTTIKPYNIIQLVGQCVSGMVSIESENNKAESREKQ